MVNNQLFVLDALFLQLSALTALREEIALDENYTIIILHETATLSAFIHIQNSINVSVFVGFF